MGIVESLGSVATSTKVVLLLRHRWAKACECSMVRFSLEDMDFFFSLSKEHSEMKSEFEDFAN